MQRLYVPLRPETISLLVSLAEREHRTAQDQAAYLIEAALDRGHNMESAPPATTAPGQHQRQRSGPLVKRPGRVN